MVINFFFDYILSYFQLIIHRMDLLLVKKGGFKYDQGLHLLLM